MQLDNIFEDLEAQFDSQLNRAQPASLIGACNFLRVRRHDGQIAELVMPLMGLDFVAGMLLGANEFQILRFPSIVSIEFQTLNQIGLPVMRFTEGDTGEFIRMLPSPLEIQWSTPGAPEMFCGILHEARDGLLILQTLGHRWPAGVPIAALAEMRICSVENLGADF